MMCFILSAVVFDRAYVPECERFLAGMRTSLARGHGHALSWKNIKSHQQRLHAAQTLGSASWLRISSVVVCKRMFEPHQRLDDEDLTYLYTLRFLLERLSWIARDDGATIAYMLAHIVRFKLEKLREYENRLRAGETNIAWSAIERGGQIDQPHRIEQLQLADLAASAIGAAFNADDYGNTENRYLKEIASRLYRRPPGPLTTYGLKMHPWNAETMKKYQWINTI